MTRFLRTSSTKRLLSVIAGLVTAIAAGTALAMAAAGSGPVPARESLAKALRGALAAPKVQGITARITFTNHLIDASNIQGTDPLLQGANGRLWMSSGHQFRLELQSNNGDAQIVVNNGSFSVYDPTSNTAYQGKLPAQWMQQSSNGAADKLPTIATIQQDISQLVQHANVSGAIPGDVAGQPTYTVRISPKHDGGLLGDAEIAWDSVHGVPLRIAIYASNQGSPVLELKVTDISYGPVFQSNLSVSPPAGAKIVKVATPSRQQAGAASDRRDRAGRHHHDVSGAAAVARHLPFTLAAPQSLVGLKQRSVTLLDWNHSPAALVAYGQGIGGIAVIEQAAKPAVAGAQSSSSSSGDHQGLSLPTVSIHGSTAQELDTALGTMIRFTRAGVSYIVIGSVTPYAAELAAKAL